MDNKIIEVLDYLGEKIGLAIDWSSNNVYPQVMEFLGRYQTYHIVTDILWMLLLAGVIVFFFIWRKRLADEMILVENEKNQTDHFKYYSYKDEAVMRDETAIWYGVFIGVTIIAGIIFLCVTGNLVKWIVIPEERFYYAIMRLMQ